MAEISRHMQDISETIRQKERELHEIHDLRCAQLERMVEERDQLISEASKKFELMKDDFNYNLALIDARDKEIDKLENLVKTQQQKLQEIQDEKRVLVQQLEIEKKKELERVSKHDQEKINNRVSTIEA